MSSPQKNGELTCHLKCLFKRLTLLKCPANVKRIKSEKMKEWGQGKKEPGIAEISNGSI
jgi:hypothetical protein